MRVPLSWLGEFVELPSDVSPESVHEALVTVGLEEEDVHGFEVSGPVVVGQVLEMTPEPQTNGKTINWCQVRVAPEGAVGADGGADVRGIVCGAHNFVVGDKVVVSLPGAVLPGPFPISARKTYGHVSDGMIASSRELGLGDEHDGILRLAALGLDPEVGTDAKSLLGIDDSAVEVNVTPDRGYAFSIRGIAREYAHATGAAFRDPAAVEPAARDDDAPEFSVVIDDAAPIRGRVGASVFVTRVVRGVDPGRPTPPWMVARLKLAGVRSISLVVDITNYVMFELGQPIHGYDLDTLTGGLVVRRAASGEKLETLDGQVRSLDPEDLLITDGSGAIGLAGVMGGALTEISASTSNVLIEAANFDPVSIARSARRHKLPSEASKRFERGVDPAVAAVAADRVVSLLVDLAGGTVDQEGSHYDATVPAAPIGVPAGFVSGLIGVDYTPEEIHDSLVEIGADVTASADGSVTAVPPTWRPDLTDKWTLAEEVARITGYDRIPSVLPVAPPGRGLTSSQKVRRTVANVIAAAGSVEVLSYPFHTRQTNDLFGSATGEPLEQVELANALDASAPFLRTSILPGLVTAAQRNRSRGLTDLSIFEIGSVFLPEPGRVYGSASLPAGAARPSAEVLAALDASIPPQPLHLAALLTGAAVERQPGVAAREVDWRSALDIVKQVELATGVLLEVRQGEHQAFHPGRCAEIVLVVADGETTVGFAGELLPSLALELDLPRVVPAVELDLEAIIAAAGAPLEAAPVGTKTAATQDLSLVVAIEVPAADVESAVAEGAGELLESIRLVDDYRGQGVEAGSRSLTFALRFRAEDRTLTAAEATAAKDAGVAVATERFGAQLRE